MKMILKYLVLFFCINLVGCNNTITRLWNSGPYISKAEDKAYDECARAFDKINPPLSFPEPVSPEDWHSEESRRRTDLFYSYLYECMKEKGFKK